MPSPKSTSTSTLVLYFLPSFPGHLMSNILSPALLQCLVFFVISTAYFQFSSRCLLKVYLCYIRPLLEYGCSSFVGLSVRSACQLEAVQQKALSICSVDSACIPSLSERRSSILLRLFFSILDDNVPDHLSGFCHWPFVHTATSHTHTTQFICHSPSTPSHIPVSVLSSLPHCFCLQLFYYNHLSWISVYLYSFLLYY